MSMFEAVPRPAALGGQPLRREAAAKADAPSTASPAGDPACAAPADAPAPPGGGLSALMDQARAVRAHLGDQPLPIANRDLLLIMKLLGG